MELLVESNDSNYLYVGVVGREWSDFATAFNKANGWSLQADGYVYDNGSGQGMGQAAKLRTGARVTLKVDMGAKRIEFLVNGASIKACDVTVSEVCLAAGFGGSNQLISIQSVQEGAGGLAVAASDGSYSAETGEFGWSGWGI